MLEYLRNRSTQKVAGPVLWLVRIHEDWMWLPLWLDLKKKKKWSHTQKPHKKTGEPQRYSWERRRRRRSDWLAWCPYTVRGRQQVWCAGSVSAWQHVKCLSRSVLEMHFAFCWDVSQLRSINSCSVIVGCMVTNIILCFPAVLDCNMFILIVARDVKDPSCIWASGFCSWACLKTA